MVNGGFLKMTSALVVRNLCGRSHSILKLFTSSGNVFVPTSLVGEGTDSHEESQSQKFIKQRQVVSKEVPVGLVSEEFFQSPEDVASHVNGIEDLQLELSKMTSKLSTLESFK